MGSFNAGGQRYSLMTLDALKASRFDGKRRTKKSPFPVTSDIATIYLDNFPHIIEPVRYNETEIIDYTGKP